jgi:hypothetical protein
MLASGLPRVRQIGSGLLWITGSLLSIVKDPFQRTAICRRSTKGLQLPILAILAISKVYFLINAWPTPYPSRFIPGHPILA